MSGDTVFSQRVEERLRRLALPDERTPFQTVIRVMPLLLDLVDAAHCAVSDTVDGLTYCGLCHWAVDHCDDHPGCWGIELRVALAALSAPVLDEAVGA